MYVVNPQRGCISQTSVVTDVRTSVCPQHPDVRPDVRFMSSHPFVPRKLRLHPLHVPATFFVQCNAENWVNICSLAPHLTYLSAFPQAPACFMSSVLRILLCVFLFAVSVLCHHVVCDRCTPRLFSHKLLSILGTTHISRKRKVTE